MIIEKILEAQIDINDIVDIYCKDYNKMLLDLLTKKYANKCFRSIFIIEILEILKRGSILGKAKTLDGNMSINIIFKVRGIVYTRGEIIHKCKILQINNNNTMNAKANHTALQIKNTTGMDIFKEDDEIPVIVNLTRYNIFTSEISVWAVPLMPLKKNLIAYEIAHSGEYTNSELPRIFAEISDLDKTLTALHKTNKSVYDFFRNLLYPYKTYQKFAGTVIQISADKFQNLPKECIIIRPVLYLDEPKCFLTDKNIDQNDEIMVVQQDYYTALETIANEYKENLAQLLGFIQTYDNLAKMRINSHIWQMYNLLKQ